ncbi:MAG TPA: hypothetical protein VMM12_09790 [Longimicrobiales bacterium]|nr:hypothetical protein [Longimicrobiales bacterium]
MNRLLGLALVGVIAASACGPRGDDQETGSISREDVHEARESLDPAVAAALDSGNAAYRAKRYAEARDHYAEATRLGDDVAAGWFGLYMAELALGNPEAAEAAVERARALAPGASLIRPTEMDSAP